MTMEVVWAGGGGEGHARGWRCVNRGLIEAGQHSGGRKEVAVREAERLQVEGMARLAEIGDRPKRSIAVFPTSYSISGIRHINSIARISGRHPSKGWIGNLGGPGGRLVDIGVLAVKVTPSRWMVDRLD